MRVQARRGGAGEDGRSEQGLEQGRAVAPCAAGVKEKRNLGEERNGERGARAWFLTVHSNRRVEANLAQVG